MLTHSRAVTTQISPQSEVACVSVILATIGRIPALRRCLDALLTGARIPAEIVVVDQSLGPAVGELLSSYVHTTVRLIHLPQKRLGLSAARNAGIAASQQKVLAMIDEDCVPDKRWLLGIDQAFGSARHLAAITGRVLPLGPTAPGMYAISTRSSTVRKDFCHFASPWHIGTGGNLAVTRSAIGSAGGYNELLGTGTPGQAGEDMDLFFRLLRIGATIRYDPKVLVYHERRDWARRIASRFGYGHGIGTFCGLLARRGDLVAVSLLLRWFTLRLNIVLRRIVAREWIVLQEEAVLFRGTVSGIWYGLCIKQVEDLCCR